MSTQETSGLSVRTDSLTSLHWFGIALAAVTGLVHLALGVQFVSSPLGWSFLFAGVGFFAGAVAVVVEYRRRLVYLLGIPFTGGQVVAWYVVNAPEFSTLGYVDKAAQVLLVGTLVVLYRRNS